MSIKTRSFNRSVLRRVTSTKYRLKTDFTELSIDYNDRYNTLFINGSIPWFLNGHNLSSSMHDLKYAVDILSESLDVDLTLSGIRCLEYGKVLRVDYPVSEYQDSLLDLKGFERVTNQSTLYYNKYTRRNHREVVLKIYDVVKNARSKNMTLQPQGNILKYEMKLFNPSKHFSRAITANDLINDSSISKKLYSQMKFYYDETDKMKVIKLPENPTQEELILGALIESNPNPMKSIDRLLKASSLERKGASKRRCSIRNKLNELSVGKSKYFIKF